MPAYLTSLGTAVPKNIITQNETLDFMQVAYQLSEKDFRKMRLFYKQSGILQRHSVLNDFSKNKDFSFFKEIPKAFPTTSERMKIYEKEALPLALLAVENAKIENLQDITHLITLSCTGMYAPGLDIELVNALSLPTTVHRTCINFMGCYAAFNALKVAKAFCAEDENNKVLIVGLELCTLHLQPSLSEDDWLANALFADGAAALIVQGKKEEKSWELKGFYSDLAVQGQKEMAWYIRDYGFVMRLSSYVASVLQEKLRAMSSNIFKKWKINLEDIQHFALHPGGKKILVALEEALNIPSKFNEKAYEILEQNGNMSSVTVWFVWEKYWQESETTLQKNDKILFFNTNERRKEKNNS
jgi:predicted naringenin-chalcone synthase